MLYESEDSYFWSQNFLIVKKITKPDIENAIQQMLKDGLIEEVLSKIGKIEDVFTFKKSFEEIIHLEGFQ